MTARLGGVEVALLGRDALIRNKRTTARPKDRLDADELERRAGP